MVLHKCAHSYFGTFLLSSTKNNFRIFPVLIEIFQFCKKIFKETSFENNVLQFGCGILIGDLVINSLLSDFAWKNTLVKVRNLEYYFVKSVSYSRIYCQVPNENINPKI